MSYPKQDSVINRLHDESLVALDALQEKSWTKISRQWDECRRDLRGLILDTYRQYFREGRWNLTMLKASGAAHVLTHGIAQRLAEFRSQSHFEAKTHLNEIYKQSILRSAWILDQTTPPNIKIRIPHRVRLFEAGAVNYYTGEKAAEQLGQRWGSWVDSYNSALLNNIQMGALNESSMLDAADEVDATRVNTPQSDLLDALQRVFMYESAMAQSHASSMVIQTNEELDVEEIWETRRDVRVCDDCDANEGLTQEEADGTIPMHPNCNCYWRIVPASWAKLLRSGNPDDYDLAVQMDARNLVPNTMVIRDAAGNIAGYTVVDFQEWVENSYPAISAR